MQERSTRRGRDILRADCEQKVQGLYLRAYFGAGHRFTSLLAVAIGRAHCCDTVPDVDGALCSSLVASTITRALLQAALLLSSANYIPLVQAPSHRPLIPRVISMHFEPRRIHANVAPACLHPPTLSLSLPPSA